MEFQALLRFDSTVTVESLKGGHAGTFEKYEAYAVRDFVCIIVCGRVLAVHVVCRRYSRGRAPGQARTLMSRTDRLQRSGVHFSPALTESVRGAQVL